MKPESRKRKPKPWRIALVGGYFHGEKRQSKQLAAKLELSTIDKRAGLVPHIYLPIWHDPAKRKAVYAYCSQAKQ